EESAMISGVMRLADRTARALMTPRLDVEIIDIDDSLDEIRTQLHLTKRSRLPVRKGSSDEVIGILPVTDFYDSMSEHGTVDIKALTQDV
ncbi:DNA-binding protein, partial [Rhizobium ruizarguesonis]